MLNFLYFAKPCALYNGDDVHCRKAKRRRSKRQTELRTHTTQCMWVDSGVSFHVFVFCSVFFYGYLFCWRTKRTSFWNLNPKKQNAQHTKSSNVISYERTYTPPEDAALSGTHTPEIFNQAKWKSMTKRKKYEWKISFKLFTLQYENICHSHGHFYESKYLANCPVSQKIIISVGGIIFFLLFLFLLFFLLLFLF